MFKLNKTSGSARSGTLKTAHGEIKTPFFMPIATVGAIKGLTTDEIGDLGGQIILSNTYHLHLRPGEDTAPDLEAHADAGVHTTAEGDEATPPGGGGVSRARVWRQGYRRAVGGW